MMFNKNNYKNKQVDNDENVFWITMTDLLLGLAIIFITLFVLAMTGFTRMKLQQQAVKTEVAKELQAKMQTKNIELKIDNLTGDVKISDLELFKLNSWELSDNGKQYLNKFIPVYVDTIFSDSKLSDKITNVVIQGHTDSQTYKSVSTKEEQFTKNMELSLKRANAVAEYVFKTPYDKKYTDKLTKTLMVEGKSYTEPVWVSGKEDYAKSRRVELELVVKDSNFQDFLKKAK